MEQIRLIQAHALIELEGCINNFLMSLDESTDVISVEIDSNYKDHSFQIPSSNLLATIRFATYKIDDTEPEESEEPTEVSHGENYGYPINNNRTDYGMESIN